MTRDQSLIFEYDKHKEYLLAWGNLVTEKIQEKIKEQHENDYVKILQIPPCPRIKSDDSLIEKAFYRKKNYSNPIKDITDKVGTRFVMLHINCVEEVSSIIEKIDTWHCEKDKDIDAERNKEPCSFSYQSDHFIVRNKNKELYKEIEIPENTPCEVQVRTLLQHAYSELTHDMLYKPNANATPDMHRLMARSSALIEVADENFIKALEKMSESIKRTDNMITLLQEIYKKNVGNYSYESKINNYIFDAYENFLKSKNIDPQIIVSFYKDDENAYIFNKIQEKTGELFFRQPIVLLIYYLVKKMDVMVRKYWPATDDILRTVFTDVGVAFDL